MTASANRNPQTGAPLQARGFTVAERERVRIRLQRDYGTETDGVRAVLRAFTRNLNVRYQILDASRRFTDPTRLARPDQDGDLNARALYVEGFDAIERDRISRALTAVYRTVSQGIRSLALAYESSADVRAAVQALIPPPQVGA